MSLKIYRDVEQASDEWFELRRGIVTASTVGQLITPKTVKPASNDYSRALTANLVAERITGHVEPVFPNRAMTRGNLDEPYARDIYAKHYAPVEQVAFMVNDDWDYSIGYSPDGLVGEDGLIEIKSRDQKVQLQTVLADEVPLYNMAQLQAGLLVSGRDWIDYVSYSSGMPLYVKRVYPDARWSQAIAEAVEQFEHAAADMIHKYETAVQGMPTTERIDHWAEAEMVF